MSHTIITDNGRQFIDKELAKFYTGLGIKHITSLVGHLQTNGQAKAANKVILVELRKRLDGAKGKWLEELFEVLWTYRCTSESATNESPFSLVYGTKVMILVEIEEPSLRRQLYDDKANQQSLRTGLDLLTKLREKAHIKNMAAKQRATRKYNSKLQPRVFVKGDLVRRMASSAREKDERYSTNWDGPYRVFEDVGGDVNRLEHLSRDVIPNTWNISHLKFYFS